MSRNVDLIAASIQEYFPNGGRDWESIQELAAAISKGKIEGVTTYENSAEKYQSLDWHAEPIIKWINENCNPHSVLVIDGSSAVLYTGEYSFLTEKFIRD